MSRRTGFRKGAGFFTMAVVLLFSILPVKAAERLQDVGEKLVIVIDPGHGGSENGTTENGHLEKAMNLITAQAMYQQLSLYEGVEVHMTRTDDSKMTLKERAEFAASVEADFLFSIHYNSSENHEPFGSEVWVSLFPPFNAYGYQFGHEILTDMRERGLLIRGVKTRIDSKGRNYYGIIRESEDLGVPAVIIEHCYVNEARDEGYCENEEDCREFGRMDAEAAARYFGLKSSVLGTDYSEYSLVEASENTPVSLTDRDDTPPDVCQIELSETDYGTGYLSLTVTAADYDSCLLYYTYSLDGGKTFSARDAWPTADTLTGYYPDTFTLNLQIPSDISPTVILRAYNRYDLYTESQPYISGQSYHYEGEPEAVEAVALVQPTDEPEAAPEEVPEVSPTRPPDVEILSLEDLKNRELSEASEKEVKLLDFVLVCLIIVAVFFVILFVSQIIARAKGKKRS